MLLLDVSHVCISNPSLSIYLMALGDQAQLKSIQIAHDLRSSLPGAILYNDITLGSFKSQFKKADKANADYALILGEEELSNNQVSIKPLKGQGSQKTMSLDEAINYFKDNANA